MTKKLNGNLVCVLVASVIITAIAGIAICVKHVVRPELFD